MKPVNRQMLVSWYPPETFAKTPDYARNVAPDGWSASRHGNLLAGLEGRMAPS